MNTIVPTTFSRSSRFHMNRAAARGGVRRALCFMAWVIVGSLATDGASAAGLRAGVAKVDITNRQAGPVNDPLFVKALVVKDDATTLVMITVDAVAIGEIGYIGNDYLANVRSRIE